MSRRCSGMVHCRCARCERIPIIRTNRQQARLEFPDSITNVVIKPQSCDPASMFARTKSPAVFDQRNCICAIALKSEFIVADALGTTTGQPSSVPAPIKIEALRIEHLLSRKEMISLLTGDYF